MATTYTVRRFENKSHSVTNTGTAAQKTGDVRETLKTFLQSSNQTLVDVYNDGHFTQAIFRKTVPDCRSVAMTGAAVQLPDVPGLPSVVLQNPVGNAEIYIGPTGVTNHAGGVPGFRLNAGDTLTVPVGNANLLFALGTNAEKLVVFAY